MNSEITVEAALLWPFRPYRYKNLLGGVDLTKDFYFSYTYPIMQNMQANVKLLGENRMPFENMFVWNAFLTSGIRQCLKNTRWIVALVHGFFEQVYESITLVSMILTLSKCFIQATYAFWVRC